MSANLGNIKDKGGNKIAVVELDENNQIPFGLTAGANCIDAGHIANSDLAIKTKKTIFKNEAGETVASDFDYEGITSGILMETNKQKLDFFAFTVRNKKHLEYKYLGFKGGNYQEVFKIVEITPQMKIAAPGGSKSMPYESTAIVIRDNFTISSGSIAQIERALGIDIKTAGPVTIPGGTEHVIVETAVS
jgi:hypothetical protein